MDEFKLYFKKKIISYRVGTDDNVTTVNGQSNSPVNDEDSKTGNSDEKPETIKDEKVDMDMKEKLLDQDQKDEEKTDDNVAVDMYDSGIDKNSGGAEAIRMTELGENKTYIGKY